VIAGVDHVGIVVADLDAAARLFGDLPGLDRTQRRTVAALAAGGTRFTSGAGQDAETHEPLEVGGLRTLFTISDSTAGLALQPALPLEPA
jgi:catechol 2,3-dioxygenase-like lactoylglutathione lyase family enzyme